MLEFVKLRQHQESSDNKLLLLRDRLQGMEKNQQQILSFLVMAMQIPGFMVQLLQPKENNWYMTEAGNMLECGKRDDKQVASGGIIMKYKPPISEKLKPVVIPSCGSDKQSEPDLSADGLKDYFINSDFLKVLMDEKLLERGKRDDKQVASGGIIMKYKPPISEKLKPVVIPSCGSDKQPEPDLSADGLKDYFINSDCLKVLMDEKLCQFGNHSPFIQPDLSDDSSWEPFLLGSPFWEDVKDSNVESDRSTDIGMEMEPTLCETLNEKPQNFVWLIAEMDKTQKVGWNYVLMRFIWRCCMPLKQMRNREENIKVSNNFWPLGCL